MPFFDFAQMPLQDFRPGIKSVDVSAKPPAAV